MKAETIKVKISGMTCDHCARSIEKKFEGKPGILEKTVSYPQASGEFKFDSEQINKSEIIEIIKATGHYRVVDELPGEETSKGSNGQQHLIIIGGGSAAFAAAIRAVELDAWVTMINDGLPIGGTCVNVGCVPSKTLIRAAETHYRANHPRFAGIETGGRVSDFAAIIGQKRELVGQLRQEKYLDVVAGLPGVQILNGRARLTSATTVEVNGEVISGDKILIATGAAPYIPPVPGLAESGFLTNETAFELEELPESLIVLGGRYIALEIGQMFARLGSKVTILQRSPRILPTEAADLTNALSGYLSEEGIDIVTGVGLQSVRRRNGQVEVQAVVKGEKQTFRAAQLVAATGRKPNTGDMGLEKVGVAVDEKGFLQVDETRQSSVPGIYGAGDVVGEPMFVYTAAYEGKLAAENALSGSAKSRDYTALPWVIFTDPQVAGVGPDELQARQMGIDSESTTLPLSYVPRSLAARDTRGFIKLIRDRSNNKLIGARILAPEGAELLMEVALAIKFGITVDQISEMFHPYLTLSEGIKLAAITFSKDVKELSCCAT
ncbi:MAG: mercury(II) reductase [Calditrichia bacterium]